MADLRERYQQLRELVEALPEGERELDDVFKYGAWRVDEDFRGASLNRRRRQNGWV